MKKFNYAVFPVAGFLVAAVGFGEAQAATVNLSYDLEVAHLTAGGVRSNTSTHTTDIAGSIITAVYTDGSSEELTWERWSDWSGGIVSDGIDLAFNWWGFDLTAQNRLASLTLNLAPSGSIFDGAAYAEGDVGNTPTTKGGIPFHLTNGNDAINGAVNAECFDLVELKDNEAGPDAFTGLRIDFSGTEGGGVVGPLTLALDMDVLAGGANDLTPVPLPASQLLLVAGLGALMTMRMRQKSKKA